MPLVLPFILRITNGDKNLLLPRIVAQSHLSRGYHWLVQNWPKTARGSWPLPPVHVTLICLEAWGIIETSSKVPPCGTCFLSILVASSLLSGEPNHLVGPQTHELMLPLTFVMLLFIGGEPMPFPHLSVYSLLQLTVSSAQIPLLPQSFPWQLSPDRFNFWDQLRRFF